MNCCLDQLAQHGPQVLATIEAELEFGEVPLGVLFELEVTMSAGDGRFQVAEVDIDPLKAVVLGAGTSTTRNDGLVDARLLGCGEARKTIGDDGHRAREVLGAEVGYVLEPVGYLRQADAVRLVVHAHGLRRDDERNLVLRATTWLAADAFAAQEGVVHLDATVELPVGLSILHRQHQLVLDRPCCGVGHPELSHEIEPRDAVLGLAKQVHSQEPDVQWQLGVLQDGTRDQAAVVLTGHAYPVHAFGAPKGPGLVPAALRTDEAVAPSGIHKRVFALVMSAVEAEELG